MFKPLQSNNNSSNNKHNSSNNSNSHNNNSNVARCLPHDLPALTPRSYRKLRRKMTF